MRVRFRRQPRECRHHHCALHHELHHHRPDQRLRGDRQRRARHLQRQHRLGPSIYDYQRGQAIPSGELPKPGLGTVFEHDFNTTTGVNTAYPYSRSFWFSNPALGSQVFRYPPLAQTITHDKDGNLTHDGLRQYVYDAENRLIRILRDDFRVTMKYDYMGRRVEVMLEEDDEEWETVWTRRYLYDGWHLIAEIDPDGYGLPVTSTYFWGYDVSNSIGGAGGIGGLLLIDDGTHRYLPGYDVQGNVILLVKESDGSLAAQLEFGPYGEVIRMQGAYEKTPFRWQSKWDLDYMCADVTGFSWGVLDYGLRWYQPKHGRFINRDPIGEAGGLNLYEAFGGDPVNRWDYLGLDVSNQVSEPDPNLVIDLPEFVVVATNELKDSVIMAPGFWLRKPKIIFEGRNNSHAIIAQFLEWAWAEARLAMTECIGGFDNIAEARPERGSEQNPYELEPFKVITTRWMDYPLAQGGQDSDRGWFGRQSDRVTGAGKWVYNKLTGWHFEGRGAQNGPHPTYDQVRTQGSGWQLLGPSQSIYHDNGVGQPELKYIHPSGREAVFDGDTLQPITDPRYAGTYNYVNPAQAPENWYNVGGWLSFSVLGAGHLVTDVVPYWLGGNVRGNDPPPDPKP